MGLKAYKPTTPGRRGMTIVTTEELTKKRPEKSLDVVSPPDRRAEQRWTDDGSFRGGGP